TVVPFEKRIDEQLATLGSPLTPIAIERRATSQTCAGCHSLSTTAPESDLGGGMVFPASNGFTHIQDATLSPALQQVWLPHRTQVLSNFLCAPTPVVQGQTIGGSTIGAAN
ncbi:MAG TPA: hypothetical protein VGC41_21610, partial [Kofleriaceae bacterium]